MLELLLASALSVVSSFSSIAALRLRRAVRSLESRQTATDAEPRSVSSADPSASWHTLPLLAARDALWDWDLTTDTMRFTPRWREILGGRADEVTASSDEWFSRVHPADLTQARVDVAAQTNGTQVRFESEHRIRHDSGRWITVHWVGTILRDETGRAHRVAGSVRDTTAQRLAEEQARREAFYDSLTGLPNRALARDLLQRAIRRTRRQGERRFAALIVDVDRFSHHADALGFSAADELLRAIARRLSHTVRPGDVVARLENDVFLLLLDTIHEEAEARQVAVRVLAAFEKPVEVLTHAVQVSVSIGVAMHDQAFDTPADYIRNAEIATTAAKRVGGARQASFLTAMREDVKHRASLELDLAGAIARSELRLWYQPVFSIDEPEPQLAGFEALVRWSHPQRGLLGAHEFVSLAEETGAIVPLGAWVMSEACKHVAPMGRDGGHRPWVSVNIAARQLADETLADLVDRAVHESAIDHGRLRLEVTENVILANEEVARGTLAILRERGHTILMDDFGTGHASLSYLHRLPIGAIKIDRYFVGRMDESSECQEIVRSVVALARSLGMDAVAEGVERPQHVSMLREMGCRYVQGFLLGQPVPPEETARFVSAPPAFAS